MVAIYYFETVLKNFGKWFYKGSPVSGIFRAFYKNLSICTNFDNDWLKTWPDIRNLVFLLNEEICRKFVAICRHIFLDLQSVTKYLRLTVVFIWGSALLAGKLKFLLFKRFLLGLTKFSFFQGYCALGFHLWWKENLVKHQKVSKYYENGCRIDFDQRFFLKTSHVFGRFFT